MSDNFFLDTNILVYSFDKSHRKKRKIAQEIIEESLANTSGSISYQVVQEFLNVALRRFIKPLTIEESHIYLETVLLPLCRVYPNKQLYQLALNVRAETQYSFYDALIVASAILSGASILLSEDLQNGRSIQGITIKNPFL